MVVLAVEGGSHHYLGVEGQFVCESMGAGGVRGRGGGKSSGKSSDKSSDKSSGKSSGKSSSGTSRSPPEGSQSPAQRQPQPQPQDQDQTQDEDEAGSLVSVGSEGSALSRLSTGSSRVGASAGRERFCSLGGLVGIFGE